MYPLFLKINGRFFVLVVVTSHNQGPGYHRSPTVAFHSYRFALSESTPTSYHVDGLEQQTIAEEMVETKVSLGILI